MVRLGVALVAMVMAIPEGYAGVSSATNLNLPENLEAGRGHPVASANGIASQRMTVAAMSATATTLATSKNPTAFGQSVTFTARVSASSGTPTGKVTFKSASADLGTVTLVGGVASLSTTALGAGTRSITAVYDGSAAFAGSTSAVLSQVVNKATTTVALTSSLNPSAFGQSVTLTATVSASSGTPNGSVMFSRGGTALGTVTLTGDSAALTTSALTSGTFTITSRYLGSTDFGASSAKLTQTVQREPGFYRLTASALNPGSVTAGKTSTSTVTVTPVKGYTGKVSFSCSVSSAGTPAPTCSFSPSMVTISSTHSATSTLTVATSSDTPGGNSTISVTARDGDNLAPGNGAQTLTLTTIAVIQHIVIIFQENRSPDNLFHDSVLISRGADIASSGLNSKGQSVTLNPIDLGTSGANPQTYDLAHTNKAFLTLYDGGKMDGANLTACSPAASCPPNPQYMYVNPSDVQPYFALAERYTFGDRMFQTQQGPSFPAHQFIIAGTSAPTATSPLFAAENPTLRDPNTGCLAPSGATVAMIDAAGSETSTPPLYPCFEHPTLTDLLDTSGVTWRYYTPMAGSIWTGPVAIEHICQEMTVDGALTCTGPDWTNNVSIPQSQVLTDIANGQLAQVSWVIPDGLSSDHANASDGSGPSWVASIVNAIGSSAYWANTAIIITWDDWGGWYDHVAPPKIINDGTSWGSGYVYGFRVPLIVVSPYAKAAYISHNTHDFGSILKFVETTFDLPSLGYADAPADDLSDCFNLTQTPLTFSVIPTTFDAAHFINDKRPPTPPDDD